MLTMIAAARAEVMEPTIDIFVENPLQPIFHGATNLPDGTEMMFSLMRPEAGYFGESKVTVKIGHFTTDQFSTDHHPLNPGRYKVWISMTFSFLQPKQVQAVIGEHGQKMKGKYVSQQSGETTFDYKKEIELGGPANAALDAATRAKSIADLRKWEADSCASNVDFINAVVLAGPNPDQVLVGAKRQTYIDACKADASSRPMK